MVGIRDMDELLALNDLNGPDLAAGDRPSGLVAEECRVFFLACDRSSQAGLGSWVHPSPHDNCLVCSGVSVPRPTSWKFATDG